VVLLLLLLLLLPPLVSRIDAHSLGDDVVEVISWALPDLPAYPPHS
jgi:hypothetical protein